MGKADAALFELGFLDTLSGGDTPIHRLDPRVKVAVALAYIVAVVSFDRYQVAPLIPFALLPLVLSALAGLPAGYLLRKLLFLAPFAVLVGLGNPLFDRTVQLTIGPLPISGGWLSFASILLRFFLTAGMVLVLIATTGFHAICLALERLGLPRVLAAQLLFLYRYLFILADEGGRMARARELRSFGGRGRELGSYAPLVGNLLLRTWDRAQRIHLAMLARGFRGEFRFLRPLGVGGREAAFAAVCLAAIVLLRLCNLPRLVGELVMGVIG